MLTIKGSVLSVFPVAGLKHVRDLMWLDGPLLSEYVHPQGDRYLYCWSDCDSTGTRWMVMRVAEQSILRLANGKLPLHFVIPTACPDDFVYFVDVLAGKRKETKVILSQIRDIPADYLPKKGVFLDEPESARDGKYTVLLDGTWNPTELFDIPKSFEQAYSFLHAHKVMQVQSLEKLPWRGGFSSMYFDNWVRQTIMSPNRLGLNKILVSSPGFIRFSGDELTAEYVAKCVNQISSSSAAHQLYSELTAYIRKHAPRDADFSKIDWAVINPTLLTLSKSLATSISVIDYNQLLHSVKTPYEVSQVLRWFYRRLRPLVDFQKAGKLQFMRERD